MVREGPKRSLLRTLLYGHARADHLTFDLLEKCKDFDRNDLEFESLRSSHVGPLTYCGCY